MGRLIALCICVCGLVTFSTPLSASSAISLTLGTYNGASPQYGGEYVGPYPGTLGSDGGPVFCLDANLTDGFSDTYGGIEESLGEVNQQDVEESAFLASLMMFDAQEDGIILTPSGSGGSLLLNQTASGYTTVSEFVNNVEGPISWAIWQLMGTLGGVSESTSVYNSAQPYVAQANAAYNKVLKNSSDPVVAAFDSSVMVFLPTGDSAGTQRFITADLDVALIDEAAPEPGTMVLFGAGVVLMILGYTRRLGRRPR
jgi:hypothetical protein